MSRFSIITVTFKDLEGLIATEQSLMSQTCSDWEWIVVDGGTGESVKSFLENSRAVTRYLSEPDEGIYHAMNKGCELAGGKYVVFLNSGDVLAESTSLQEVDSRLLDVDLGFLGAKFSYENSRYRYRKPRKFSAIWHSVPANHQATVFRLSMLGEKPYNETFRICGDYELMANLYKKGCSWQCLDIPFVQFGVGGVSTFEIEKLAVEALRVQREVLNTPRIIRFVSWIRRQISMRANLVMYKFSK